MYQGSREATSRGFEQNSKWLGRKNEAFQSLSGICVIQTVNTWWIKNKGKMHFMKEGWSNDFTEYTYGELEEPRGTGII